MPTKNGQFEYPQEDWAVGKMAKAGPRMTGGDPGREFRELMGQKRSKEQQLSQTESQYPMLSQQEWDAWQKMPPHRGRTSVNKDEDVKGLLDQLPKDGFLVDSKHPGIKDLEKDFDIFGIPGNGNQFMLKPKTTEPLTSEWETPGMQKGTG